jgi:ATP-dependent protease HslVU (ClpYQ) peptidase subunit
MQGRGFCDALDLVTLSGVVDVLISNPGFLPVRGQLYDIAANLALQRKDADTALKYLNKALSASPKIDRKIFKVKILIAQAAITDATTLLVQIEGKLRTMPKEMMFYREQIRELKLQLAKAFPTENN